MLLSLEIKMNLKMRYAFAATVMVIAAQASAQVVFYEHDRFDGRSFTTEKQVSDFGRYGFNDRASSVIVLRDQWEVCEAAQFHGRCIVLRPGRYNSLNSMGLDKRVSSARIVNANARYDTDRYAPEPVPVYDNHRRKGERLYEAEVTSVRAVVATPEQRCWIEHEDVPQQRSGANVPGAIIGAVIGGVLGHQVGGGRGKDLATVGGAVVGGAVGANVNRDRDGQQAYSHDVQHCESAPREARAEYWDVTYNFRGEEHRIQTVYQPGRTVTVNQQGEPRA
jgi:uncharacterized protein YcfJ